MWFATTTAADVDETIPLTSGETLTDDKTNINDKLNESKKRISSVGLVSLSALLYGILNISIKELMEDISWMEMMFIRYLISWMITLFWIKCIKQDMSFFGPKHKFPLLMMRSFFLWLAMFCCWWSFSYLPVGDATTISMSFPFWVSIISHFVFYHQPQSRLDGIGWICVLLGSVGVFFVAQPELFSQSHYTHRNRGISIAIFGAISAAIQYIIVKYTRRGVHWLQVEQVTSLFSTFLFMPSSFIIYLIYHYLQTGELSILWNTQISLLNSFYLIFLALLGFFALASLTKGSQLDITGRASLCLYLEIPVTYIGQCMISQSLPNQWDWIGIFLILCSVFLTSFHTTKKSPSGLYR